MALTEAEELELLELEEEEARAKQPKPTPAAEPAKSGFFDKLGSTLEERGAGIKTALGADQTPFEKGLQATGEIARGAIDVPLTALSTGYSALKAAPLFGGGIKALEGLAGKGLSAYMSGTNQIPGIQAANRAISETAAEHPRAVHNLEAVANIAGVVPTGKILGAAGGAAKYATAKGLTGAGKVMESAAEKAVKPWATLSLHKSPLVGEAMRAASIPEEAQKLTKAFKQEYNIGQDIAKELEQKSLKAHLGRESEIIESALDDMPSISPQNAIDALENAKIRRVNNSGVSILEDYEKEANREIDKMIANLKGEAKQEVPSINSGIIDEAHANAMDAFNEMEHQANIVRSANPKLVLERNPYFGAGAKRELNRADIKRIFHVGPDEFMDADFNVKNIKTGTPRFGIDQYAIQAEKDMDELVNNAADHIAGKVKAPTKAEIKKDLLSSGKYAPEPTTELAYNQATGEINPLIDEEDLLKAEAKKNHIPAKAFIDKRRAIDRNINFDNEGKDIIEGAAKAARKAMKEDLIKTAIETERPEYVAAMKKMAEKLDAHEDMVSLLGRNEKDRAIRAQNFVRLLEGEGKDEVRKIVENYDRLHGTNFAERAHYAALAKQFGPESGGVPTFLSTHGQGKSAPQIGSLAIALQQLATGHVAPAAGAVLASTIQSPLVASKTIGATRRAGQALQRAGKRLGALPEEVVQTSEEIYSPVYHGTAKEFDSFDKNMLGSVTGAKSAHGAFWFTDDPNTAKAYSIYAAEDGVINQMQKTVDKLEKIAQRSGKESDWTKYEKAVEDIEKAASYDATFERRKLANIKQAVLDGDFHTVDAKGKTPQELSKDGDIDSWLDAQVRKAKDMGKDGLVIKNIDDAVGLHDRPSTHYAVFDPKIIKIEKNPKINPDIANLRR